MQYLRSSHDGRSHGSDSSGSPMHGHSSIDVPGGQLHSRDLVLEPSSHGLSHSDHSFQQPQLQLSPGQISVSIAFMAFSRILQKKWNSVQVWVIIVTNAFALWSGNVFADIISFSSADIFATCIRTFWPWLPITPASAWFSVTFNVIGWWDTFATFAFVRVLFLLIHMSHT